MFHSLFNPRFTIDSKEKLTEAIKKFKLLPFFPINVKGLSIEEMCTDGKLFGGNHDEGCWEWKGPVIRQRSSAYGKFFRKKVGFVDIEFFPDFLNYRRKAFPVISGTTEEMLLEIIKENDSLSSSELKNLIYGFDKRRHWDIPPHIGFNSSIRIKSKSLETPLQRLQMGGWIIISDFEYKITKRGERYGWGIARYSTPEIIFGDSLKPPVGKTPEESIRYIIKGMKKIWIRATGAQIWESLLR